MLMRGAYAKIAQERAADHKRLDELRTHILSQVPGAGIAADQAYRDADLAIDFCEDLPALPGSDIERVVAPFEAAGATPRSAPSTSTAGLAAMISCP